MKAHPIADLFPLLEGEELQALADDIKANGLHEAILVYEGEILDGRNRWLACEMAGVSPRVEDYRGLRSDIPARIVSKNLRRRHLTESQRALIGAKIEEILAAPARERMLAGKSADPMAPVPQGTARDQAAAVVGVSGRTIQDAKTVIAKAPPEAVQAIREGKSTVKAEARKIRAQGSAKARKPKPSSDPTPHQTGTYTNRQGYVMTYTVPVPGATKVEVAFLKHAPVLEAAGWFDRAVGAQRINELLRWHRDRVERESAELLVEPDGEESAEPTTPIFYALADAVGRAVDQLVADAEQEGVATAPDDLQDRVRAVLPKFGGSESKFATDAGMSQGTLNRFMRGVGKATKANRAKIEAALAKLAEAVP